MGVPINYEPQPGVYNVNNVSLTKNQDGTYTITPGSQTSGGAPRVSQGNYFVPTASPNGMEFPNRPAFTSGAILTIGPATNAQTPTSITIYKAPTGSAPGGAPGGNTKTFSNTGTAGALEYSVRLSGNDSIYATAISGSVMAEWVQT